MQIMMIEGHTRVLGKSQGYLGLPVRDEITIDKATGEHTPMMTTSWEPTPAELKLLNEGKPVSVTIFGTAHPPIMIQVKDNENEG